MSQILYAHEFSSVRAKRIEGRAAASRPYPKRLQIGPEVPRESARKAAERISTRREAMNKNEVMVCGRVERGRVVWDVLKLQGPKVTVYAIGCAHQGEAYELADACLSGRIATSLSGTRSLIVANSGLPDTHLRTAPARPDMVLPSGEAIFIPRPRPQKKG